MEHNFNVKGEYRVQIIRDGKIIDEEVIPNGVTTVGKTTILNVMFGSTSKIADWYIGLIQDGSYTGLAAGDTMASHSGWVEFTGYSQSTRPEWDPSNASSTSISNSTARTFSITTGDTLKGVFIADENTKTGNTGTLWGTALFSSDKVVTNGDSVKIIYTVSVT